MNVCMLHQRTISRGLIFRTLAVVVALVGIGQLRAQPLDTLAARMRGIPVDSLIAREAAATDPRVKCAAIARLVSQYLFLGARRTA